MGVLRQLRLLLNKNLLVRRRHPGILFLEIVWPIFIVAIVAVLRIAMPVQESLACHYQERAMPSSGLFPFLQTFVCNLGNKCHSMESRQVAEQTSARVSALVQNITPYVADPKTLDLLDNLDKGVTLMNSFSSLAKNDSIFKELDNATYLARYFRDPDKVKTLLVEDYNFTEEAVDAVMASQVNVTAILELSGYPQLKGIVCDPKRLSYYLIFPEGSNVTEVSRSLCDVNDSKIPEITEFVQRQLDVAEMIRLLGLFESLKERLNLPYTLAQGLFDVADMLDLLLSIKDFSAIVSNLTAIKDLPDIIRNVPQWIDMLIQSRSALEPLEGFFMTMDPIVTQFFPNNTFWMTVEDGLYFVSSIIDLLTGSSNNNATAAEIVNTASTFIHSVETMLSNMTTKEQDVLSAFFSVDWPQFLTLLYSAAQDNYTTVESGLGVLQEILMETPLEEYIARYLPVTVDLAHFANVLLHGLLRAVQYIWSEMNVDGFHLELKQSVELLLESGPTVTLAVLRTFTHPDTLTDLLANYVTFSDVCADVIRTIGNDVGQTAASDLNRTLCHGVVPEAVSAVVANLGVENISSALNKTIAGFASLISGSAPENSMSFLILWQEIQKLIHNLEELGNTTTTSWAELLGVNTTQTYSSIWNPVLDLLNDNYFGTRGVLSLLTAAGRLINDSDSEQWIEVTFGPYIHVASIMMKNLHTVMENMMVTYSEASSLGQLVYYSTTYAPQIVAALFDMNQNGNIDMIYQLASSPDPLTTFCEEHILQQINLSLKVAIDMEEAICLTNWTEVWEQISSPQTMYNTLVQKVMQALDELNNQSVNFSLESDWQVFSYYLTQIVEMLIPSQDSAGGSYKSDSKAVEVLMSLTNGPWNLIMYANFSQLSVAAEVVMTRMHNLTNDDLNVFINILARVMESTDQKLSSETSNTKEILNWRQLKLIFRILDTVNNFVVQYSKQDNASLSALMEFYPEELKHMVVLAAGAYLEFIEALKGIIMKPEQLIQKIISQDLQAPNCDNISVTDLLNLAPDSNFGHLEMTICTANWTDISMKMSNTPKTQALIAATSTLIQQFNHKDLLETDPVVNWTEVLHNTVQSVKTMSTQLSNLDKTFSNWDLLPFNMTAIRAKWSEVYQVINSVKNVDFSSLTSAVMELQILLENKLFNGTSDSGMAQILSANLYLSQHILDFINKQLQYFNSTRKVVLLDMLGSDELQKVGAVLRFTPEINEIFASTLIRLLSNPYLIAVTDFSSLCTNLTVFTEVVAVNNSLIDSRFLQQTVCGLNTNFTVVVRELRQNWNGFAELMDAIEQLIQNDRILTVNISRLTEIQLEYSHLLSSVIQNPPDITFISDNHWMNVSLYEETWKIFFNKLQMKFENFQNISNLQVIVSGALQAIASIPSAQPALYYIDYLLDTVYKYTVNGGSFSESFTDYPNMQKLFSLLEQLPELAEMLVYTSLHHPEQLINWGTEMTSWETFCSANPTNLMTAPPESGLNVVEVLDRLCSVNFTQLLIEFSLYQGMDRLNAMIAGDDLTVNVTAMVEKLKVVLGEFGSLNSTSLATSMDFNLRFINSSVWAAVFTRLEKDFNLTVENFKSPEMWLQIFINASAYFPEVPGLQDTMTRVLAVVDVILDQILQALEGGSLQEMLSRYPSLLSTVSLLDHLPEIFETLAYTGLYTPERIIKLAERTEGWTSFEGFCSLDLSLHLTVPPHSGYSPTTWQQTFCSINITSLLEELAEYQGATDFINIFTSNTSYSLNLTSISQKLTNVMSQFGRQLAGNITQVNINDYLNITAWERVTQNLQNWMKDAVQVWGNPQVIVSGALQAIASIPSAQPALYCIDYLLDTVYRYTVNGGSFSESFTGYPNMQKLFSLLEQLPELAEMLVYTSLHHPEQLINWGTEMTSWETFCSANPTNLMTAPPESGLNVVEVLDHLCSVNFTQLLIEFSLYQGMDRLNAMIAGDDLTVNVTAMVEKLKVVLGEFGSLNSTSLATNMDFNLRFINSSVWAAVFTRLEKDFNLTVENFKSPEMWLQIFINASAWFPEVPGLQDTMTRVLAVVDVILDQILQALEGGSLQEMLSRYPSLLSTVTLLDHLPEIFETLVYTGLYTPERIIKLAERTEGWTSFEGFCSLDLSLHLTVPPHSGYSPTTWQRTFCSINITSLLEELAEYQGATDFINIFTPNTSYSLNLTSISQKLTSVMSQFGRQLAGNITQVNINDYLNITAWERVTQNLQNWMKDAVQVWGHPGKVIGLFGHLIQQFPNRMIGLEFLQPALSVLDLLSEKLLLFENRTSLTLSELFAGVPELQKLFQLLEEPGVIEILIESASSKQFQSLLHAPNLTAAFDLMCAPSASLSEFLVVPKGVSIDLSLLKTSVCDIHPWLLEQEIRKFFDIDHLTAVLNGSVSVNYTNLIERIDRVTAMITRWLDSPPVFSLPAAWQNESYWLGLLENYAMAHQDPTRLLQEFESFADILQKVAADGLMNRVMPVVQTVMQLVNENLMALQSQNLTLESLFATIPIFQDVFSALGIEGDILDAMLKAPVLSGHMLLSAFLTDGLMAQRSICNITRLQELLYLPASFEYTALYQSVCHKNSTEAVNNLLQNLDLQDLIDDLQSPASVANWSSVFQQSKELQQNLQDLVNHPPSFNASSLVAVLESEFSTSALWQMASLFNYDELLDMLDTFPELKMLKVVVNSANVLLEFLDDLISRFEVVGGTTVDLASLFSSSPSFVRLMDAVLHAQPDVFTALTLLTVRPRMASELMAVSPGNLMSLLCEPSELNKYFSLPPHANITEIVHVLCTLNFTQFIDELDENFMAKALTKQFAAAMNESEHLSLQMFIANSLKLVEHINMLAGVRNVTFDGIDIRQAFNINETQLLETLQSIDALIQAEYPSLISLSLGSVLNNLANSSEAQTIVYILKTVEIYLHSFSKAMDDIASHPISLSSILNNTEIGRIVIPLLKNSSWLQDLMDLELIPQKLSLLLASDNVTGVLCGPELFTAFAAPGNESQVLQQLQQSACTINITVMVWQLALAQANGYQLYQQMVLLFDEVAAGRLNVNITAIHMDLQHIITMAIQIINEYKNGARSTEDLFDWRSFEDFFDRFSKSLGDRLLNMSEKWSPELIAAILSYLPDDSSSFMTRFINSINIFIEAFNGRLDEMLQNGTDLSMFLDQSESVIQMIEGFLNVMHLAPQAWVDNKFSLPRLFEVSVNVTLLDELCTSDTLAAYLADANPVTTFTSTLQTFFCIFNSQMHQVFGQFIDPEAIQKELTVIWNMSIAVEPEYQAFVDNIVKFSSLITQLATTVSPDVDFESKEPFNLTSMVNALQNIITNPERIFQLLKALGIFLDGSRKTSDLDNSYYAFNSYVAQPLLALIQSLNNSGLSLTAVLQDPSKLLEALPILSNFQLHFDLITSVYLQPMMNQFWNNEDFRTQKLCNGGLPQEVFASAGLNPSVVNALCSVPSTEWIQILRRQNATDSQIITWVKKVEEVYQNGHNCSYYELDVGTTYECRAYTADIVDNKGMYWARLMTTLESVVTSLAPLRDQATVTSFQQSLGRIWDILKDAFLNNTLKSAVNYMEIIDRMGERSEGWLLFKQTMKFLEAAGSLLRSGLQRVTGSSGRVYLQDLLPDSQRLVEVLQNFLGSNYTSEILMAAVNSQFFYHLANPAQFQSMVCDPAQFSAEFDFSADINVTALQLSFCQAVTEHPSMMQEVIDLFQAGDMLVQLDRLLNGNHSSEVDDLSLWQTLQDTVFGLLSDLEQLQSGHFNTTVSKSWIDPLLQLLTSLSQPLASGLESMCLNSKNVYGDTRDFQSVQDALLHMANILRIVIKATPLITRLDELTCIMVSEDGLDLAAGVGYLKEHGLVALFHSVFDYLGSGSGGEFHCEELHDVFIQMNQLIMNLTQSPTLLDVNHLKQCAQQTSLLFADVMQGLNQLYHVAADMYQFLGDDDFSALWQNSKELEQILDFILSIVLNQRPVVFQFSDLLTNSTDVELYLKGVLKLAPSVVNSLLVSTINLNSSWFLNRSVAEIADILCHSEQLADVLTLPEFSPVNISAISELLCTPDVNITAAVFKDAARSTQLVEQLIGLIAHNDSRTFVSSIITSLVDLVSQLQTVSTFIGALENGFDIQFLMEEADFLDSIIAGGGSIQKIIDSLVSMVGSLKYVVPSENFNIITDIQTFIRGLVGLDLIRSRLFSAVRVSDMQKDVAAVQKYLTDELDLSPEAASALLASTFSVRVFLNASQLLFSEEPCAEKLQHFILLNSTADHQQEITTKFCALNSTSVNKFMEFLVPQLDIGSLIQKYISFTGKAFLDSLNLTESGALFRSFNVEELKLQQLSVILMSDNSSMASVLTTLRETAEGEFDAMVTLQPALCGVESPVIDQFDLHSKIQGADTSFDIQEKEQLNGEFCKELYHSVKKLQLGSVIWSFIKPIMLGKILYAPDNALTREIIRNANWVFVTLTEVKQVAKRWSEKSSSFLSLTEIDRSGLQEIMNNRLIRGLLQATIGVDVENLLKSLEGLQNSSVKSSDLKSLQKIAELIYNYTNCMNLDRFEAVATEEELEKKAFELYKANNFLAGIVFLNVDDADGIHKNRHIGHSSLPPHIMYKIRMDIDNVPITNRLKDRLWMPYPDDNFVNHLRYMRGFVQLQDLVEGAILRLHTDTENKSTGVMMQQMPFPCHRRDDYIHYLGSYLLPLIMTFAWLAAIGIATYILVYDRQSGQEEALHVMGMISGLNVLAWMIVTLVIMAFVTIAITIIIRYSNFFHYSNMLLVFLFILDFCFSSIMMCYFVSAFFTRATLAILTVLVVFFISFLPYVILVSKEVQMTFWQKTLSSLSSTTAFSFGAMFITRFEEESTGLQWEKVHDKLTDSVDFAWMCYMMLIDSGIYLLLGWYIRNVMPGKYGRRQPWYFPVSPFYWCYCLSQKRKTLPLLSTSKTQEFHEAIPDGLDIGISVRGIRKVYKGKDEVVHGVDVDIFRDQVTTLLGHNGAAKTTTLNILMGVLQPSAGVVLIDGRTTFGRTGLLGVCPQHNTLFEYMTVEEHLEFYGGVKGHLSDIDQKREIRRLLEDVDLWHVKDVPVFQLSGGMQRRLCVALAFVGGSKTVVLDEPTSGIDPHARRNIWDLIIKNRLGRTILLSTHHLDEADTLSDRIIVMHMGCLLSAGSPSFMKDQLGNGYKLTLNINPMVEVTNEVVADITPAGCLSDQLSVTQSKVMSFIKSFIPSAEFVESVGCDLTVQLPFGGDSSTVLCAFFRQLDSQSDSLGVLSYGISGTTLEDVFLKLTADSDIQTDNSQQGQGTTDMESVTTVDDGTAMQAFAHTQPKRSMQRSSLKFQQLWALLLKRIHHYRRNWRIVISAIILPLLAFSCALGFSVLRPEQDEVQNLIMTPALYTRVADESFAFFQDKSGSEEGQHFQDTLMAEFPGIGTTCIGDFDPGKDFQCVDASQMFESQKKEQSCHCNDFKYECMAGTRTEGVMQMVTRPDLILQDVGPKELNHYLVTSYNQYIDRRFGGWSVESSSEDGNDSALMIKVWFDNKGYHAIPSYFNALSNNLLRSAVSPINASAYGITLYNHPLPFSNEQLSEKSITAGATDAGIAMVVLLALSFITSSFMIFLVNENIFQEQTMQKISGVGTLLYWSASFLWDMIVYTGTLAFMVIIVVIFKSQGFYDRENLGAFTLLLFLYGFAVIPLMYCTLRFFKSGSAAYLSLFCTNMLIGLLTTVLIFFLSILKVGDNLDKVAYVLKYVFLIFPQFSLGMGLVDLVTNQFQYKILKRFGEDIYVSPYDMELLGCKYVALSVQGVLFLLLAFIIHSRKQRAISMKDNVCHNSHKDDDVLKEKHRVHTGNNGDALVVKDICKIYQRGSKRFCAVDHLSFGVKKGECFGLLGVNGAGKTTTFRMLIGATTPAEGEAYIRNKKLNTLMSHLAGEIGYCPQEDALDMYLSGREILQFYARLRGFDSQQMDQLVLEQLKRLNLQEHMDKPVHTYSGGNKRKLALAIAMLGDPPLLLLDEPTTGMDASTRRMAWKCITTAKQRGQSVLLTSHSMDECDILCSRLAIMVNGELKCIGSPQHLKSKFGDGYTILLHLQGLSSNHDHVSEFLLSQFPGSIIKNQHHSVMELFIPQKSACVADIFAALQIAESQYQIAYYSVSQTTLDKVFVTFASEQTNDDDLDTEVDSSCTSSSDDPNFHKSLTDGRFAYSNQEYSGHSIDPNETIRQASPHSSGERVMGYHNNAYDNESFSTRL